MSLTATTAGNGALYVPVTLYSEDHRRRWMGSALLDTGAQFAMVHPSVIAELGLKARGESDVDTAVGEAKMRGYILRVSVQGIFDDLLSVLESQSKERFVLGRQFLQRTRLEVDWPKNSFTIRRSS